MKTRTRMRGIGAAAAVALAAWTAPTVVAQSGQNALPPAPRATDKPPALLHYAVGVLMLGGVVVLAIMPGRRTHQD